MSERRFLPSEKLLVSGVVVVFSLSMFLLPVIGELHQGPLKEAATIAKRDNLIVVRWRLNMPSFSVYTQRVTETRKPQPGEIVLTKSKYLSLLNNPEIIYRKGGVVMARVE